MHADVTRMLEVQFIDEHGFGWGVTQGFYTGVLPSDSLPETGLPLLSHVPHASLS